METFGKRDTQIQERGRKTPLPPHKISKLDRLGVKQG